MTMILIKNHQLKVIEMEANLENYYKTLNCDTIEMPLRYINHLPFIFVIDGNGKLNKHQQDIEGIGVNNIKDLHILETLSGPILIVGYPYPEKPDEERSLQPCEVEIIEYCETGLMKNSKEKPQLEYLFYTFE